VVLHYKVLLYWLQILDPVTSIYCEVYVLVTVDILFCPS